MADCLLPRSCLVRGPLTRVQLDSKRIETLSRLGPLPRQIPDFRLSHRPFQFGRLQFREATFLGVSSFLFFGAHVGGLRIETQQKLSTARKLVPDLRLPANDSELPVPELTDRPLQTAPVRRSPVLASTYRSGCRRIYLLQFII